MRFNELRKEGNSYFITRGKPFEPIISFPGHVIEESYKFAFGMTFGGEGEHRHHRSGGQRARKNGEIFINTFQGKLSEFGIYTFLREIGLKPTEPDLSQWELGIWDTADIGIDDKKLNVKSTKFFGNLLLLETKDWNDEGEYIPNINTGGSHYDYFILTRIRPNGEEIMKSNRLMYSNIIPPQIDLHRLIISESWQFDIPGFITHNDLTLIIKSGRVLPQNSLLNARARMDAENYYIQAGDMRHSDRLIDLLTV